MTATLEISGRALQVTLRNLSSNGARVEGSQLPVEGTELLFRKGDLAIDGRVIWARGNQAGVSFSQKLDPELVLHHISPPRPRMKPDFRRPGLASRELTPQERKLPEHWISITSRTD